MSNLAERAINTIRLLSVDAVQKANSGHPGLPMGAAPMAYTLWTKYLSHNPTNPRWFNRDRFVLSAGHGSMLLYSMLHLTGYDVSLDDLKNFRQWGSKTPGHPEYGHTPGVETTTGPLGQGAANAIGMAMAEAFLAAKFNREGHNIVDHYTYALVSDGDLMEGIVAEASSLAGHLKLGKLIFLYDDNEVSLAAPTSVSFTEDVEKRYESYGWHTIRVKEGNAPDAVDKALQKARSVTDRPSILLVRTILGYGSPNKAGTYEAHGSPLGMDEVKLVREFYKWEVDKPPFYIPDDVLTHLREAVQRGQQAEEAWEARWRTYEAAHPDLAAQLRRAIDGELPVDWAKDIPIFEPDVKGLATRDSGGRVLNAIAARVPTFIGGDADLAPSTKTTIKGEKVFGVNGFDQRNIAFGIREHAMGGITNGMTVHGGITKPYTATFFTFSDYMRPSMRLAALMGLENIFVFTHDSIGVGEDGPTHQPVEHLAALRAIPNLLVIRPADANETAAAWKVAIEHKGGPVALVLSRQAVPTLSPEGIEEGVRRGGYVLAKAHAAPQAIIMATGTEVSVALKAQDILEAEGIHARVVSIPCFELLAQQDEDYLESLMPTSIRARVAVEAGIEMGWTRYLQSGRFVGVGDRYGASAPAETIYEKLGITPQVVVAAVKAQL